MAVSTIRGSVSVRIPTANPLLHIIHWPWIDDIYMRHGVGYDTWGNGYNGFDHGSGMSADLGTHIEPRGPSHLRGSRFHDFGDGRFGGFHKD